MIEVYGGGPADKDGRLQLGDEILEANGVSLKDAAQEVALQTLRQTLPKVDKRFKKNVSLKAQPKAPWK